ncbi:hypothetical protein HV402_19190, partial [Bacillus sporothermodurans]|uniref:hypothetical protein n=1 Tax=Heyndrickxia sporothermodurans TaxID=46224 RepID=UPI00192BD139
MRCLNGGLLVNYHYTRFGEVLLFLSLKPLDTQGLRIMKFIHISLVDTNNSNSFVIRYTNGTWKEKRIKIKETGIVKMFMDNEYFYTLHYKENNTLLVKHSKNLDRDIKIVKIKKGISNPILDTEKNILFYTYESIS